MVGSSWEIWCSNRETRRFDEKLGDSWENRESWQVCICDPHIWTPNTCIMPFSCFPLPWQKKPTSDFPGQVNFAFVQVQMDIWWSHGQVN